MLNAGGLGSPLGEHQPTSRGGDLAGARPARGPVAAGLRRWGTVVV